MSARSFLQRLSSRRKKRILWLVGAFAAYTLIGFFIVPAVIKWQLLKQLPEITKRQAAVRQVKFNPLTLSLTVRDLSLKEADGRPFASFEEFYVNFQTSSLFRWAWTFNEIRLVRPFGELILLKDGTLNVANMLPANEKPKPEAGKSKGIPRINIFHLQLTNGFVSIEDQTRRSMFRTEYRPINFVLTGFSTRPDSDTPYSFRAESDAGRSVSWKGDFSVQPLKSAGDFEVLGVPLSRFQPYLEDFTTAVLTNGIADIRLSYRFSADTNGLDLTVTNGSLAVAKLDIRDPGTSEMVAGFQEFALTGAELNLRERSARVRQVSLSDASLLGRIATNGQFNFLQLLVAENGDKPLSAPTTTAPANPWTVTLDHFSMTNAAVIFEDLSKSRPFKTELRPISFDLNALSTAPGTSGTYRFHLVTETAEALSGEGSVSITPLASEGKVDLAGLELKKYMPYAEDVFAGRLAAGKLDVQAPYRFSIGTNGIRAGVSNLVVALAGLEIKPSDRDETYVRLERVDIERVQASLEDATAKVGRVNARGGSILARQAKDGSINLLGLLKQPATSAHTSAMGAPDAPPNGVAATNAPGWAVRLEELDLTGYRIAVEDHKPAKVVKLLAEDFALNVKGASTDLEAPVTARVGFKLGEKGVVGLDVTAQLEPLSAQGALAVTNIDLRTIQPYLDERIGLKIEGGLASTYGTVGYDNSKSSFTGDVRVAAFGCMDTVVQKPLAGWEDLLIAGIDAEFPTNSSGRVKIASITWTQPKATLVLGPDGTPNLPQMVNTNQSAKASGAEHAEDGKTSKETERAPAEPVGTRGGGAMPIEIGEVRLEKASLGFADLSIQPNATIAIEQLTGTIKGLSSALDTTAEVNLAGLVGEHSPFAVIGRVNPLASQMFLDLVVSNANTQLTPLTGYMEKFAGHPLNKGRVTTSLHYLIQGQELKAENKIQIDQLTLGARNNSPDATSLPVKLGIALLKDSNGRIELDVPVSGRLDDPQFKLGPIILKVVVNMLVKAATSPFKLLGALVGGGEELSFVQFTPGTSDIPSGELEKLEKLKKALAARPALNVDIEAQVDLATDRQVLALGKLKEQIKRSRLEELAKKGKEVEPGTDFQIEPEERQRIVRRMFVEQFGTNIVAVLQSNVVALAAQQATNRPAAQTPERHGIRNSLQNGYKAIVSFVGLGERRSPAEKKLTREEREVLNQATPEMMEQLLADTVMEVTADEYRALMTARAERVQKWLIENGGVAADRLLLVAPKPIGDGYKGESRATLSLN